MGSWSTKVRVGVAAVVALGLVGAGAASAGGLSRLASEGAAPRAGTASPTTSVFVPVEPCRLVNTQNPAGKIQPLEIRQYKMHGSTSSQGGAAACGIPQSATALELSVTAVSASGRGYLRVYPAGVGTPNATFLNYGPGQNLTNAGTVAVQSGSGVSFQVQAVVAATHVIVDVLGYYTSDLQASVNADGTVARGNGVTATSSVRTGTGTYVVPFDRDVSGCAYTVTPGPSSPGTPSAAVPTVAPASGNPNAVFVRIRAHFVSSDVDSPFHISVSC